jgi:hypothetical protein
VYQVVDLPGITREGNKEANKRASNPPDAWGKGKTFNNMAYWLKELKRLDALLR